MTIVINILSILIFSLRSEAHKSTLFVAMQGIFVYLSS